MVHHAILGQFCVNKTEIRRLQHQQWDVQIPMRLEDPAFTSLVGGCCCAAHEFKASQTLRPSLKSKILVPRPGKENRRIFCLPSAAVFTTVATFSLHPRAERSV
jgi:hypothetical protein